MAEHKQKAVTRTEVHIPPLYIDLETAAVLTTLSTPTIQALVTQDAFPKPRMLSGRRVGYLYREVAEWAENRPVSSLLPPPNTGAKKPRVKAKEDASETANGQTAS